MKDNIFSNKLIRKDGSTYDDAECSGYDELKLTKKVKFDIMIVIPVINYQFNTLTLIIGLIFFVCIEGRALFLFWSHITCSVRAHDW